MISRFDRRMWEQLKRRSSYQALPTVEHKRETDVFRDLHHPIFQSIRIIQVWRITVRQNCRQTNWNYSQQVDAGRSRYTQTQSIVTISKLITPQAMQQCLQFIYTGSIDPNSYNMQVMHSVSCVCVDKRSDLLFDITMCLNMHNIFLLRLIFPFYANNTKPRKLIATMNFSNRYANFVYSKKICNNCSIIFLAVSFALFNQFLLTLHLLFE